MDAIRLLMLASSVGATMFGGLYASVKTAPKAAPVVASERAPVEPILAVEEAALPEGVDAPAEPPDTGAIVDPESGMQLGPFTILEREVAAEVEEVEVADPEPEVRERAPARVAAARTPARRRPRPAPVPRLHPNPGQHVILTARGMMARREVVNGSCYRYISEVFERAGHGGWRRQRVVHNVGRNGPYANLGLIRPGDWLYIVNHPNRTPVGTHSVLFVSWQDRARGIANVIEHPGWGSPSAGRNRSYDVSRTYRITRPVLSR